jgi:hypothetical protein
MVEAVSSRLGPSEGWGQEGVALELLSAVAVTNTVSSRSTIFEILRVEGELGLI